jgi:hypothetical protein
VGRPEYRAAWHPINIARTLNSALPHNSLLKILSLRWRQTASLDNISWIEISNDGDDIVSEDFFVWRPISICVGNQFVDGAYACSAGQVIVKSSRYGRTAAPMDDTAIVAQATRLMKDLVSDRPQGEPVRSIPAGREPTAESQFCALAAGAARRS